MDKIQINSVIGFTGCVKDGLILHPNNEHLIFPLGSTIVIRHVLTRQQTFLRGHDNKISVIRVSNNGKYLASGQNTFMGFHADVIIWNFQERTLKHRLKLHKVVIASLSFSFDSKYLASQGGLEDKNMFIIWDVQSGKSQYGAPIKQPVHQISYFNTVDNKLLAVLQNSIQIITIDKVNKKVVSVDVNFGNVKRHFTCCAIDFKDTYCYVGTKTGDIFEINIEKAIYKRLGPVKKLFSMGVSTLRILPNGDIIAGAGDGTIGKISIQNMKQTAQCQVLGSVTSISFTGDSSHFFCGTAQSNIYWVNSTNLAAELRNTCHYEKINDVAFPANYSDVFATCSLTDIRIWNANNRQQLLRIQVPGLECYTVAFMYDGKAIISGWSDGKIRAFLPQSGKLLYCINDAHHHGVTAITATTDCQKVVSGGSQGQVRVWKINKKNQTMEASLKQHRGRVWSIQVSKNNDQALSGSGDGSCIIWDLKTYTRIICVFESTLFKQVVFHPEQYQLLTTGSNRKITYWEKFDGQVIRKIDGSEEGEINALAVMKEGQHFVTGGEDTILKIWGYDDGQKCYQGSGHSGAITKIQIAPDQKTIVTVGAEGAIFIWNVPGDIQKSRPENDLPTISTQKK